MSSTFVNLSSDVLNAIFLHVPALDLVLHCSMVCKRWLDALSGRYFWIQKLESDGTEILERNRQLLLDNEDYDLCMYILKGVACGLLPFNRNLIKNPCGQESRKHWLYKETFVNSEKGRVATYKDEDEEKPSEMTEEWRRRYPSESHPEVYAYSRYGFSIEEKPIGTQPIPEEAGVPTQHCFVTSFSNGVRTQFIDLEKYKIKDGVMELLKPTIYFSQWVAARYDSASQADLSLRLISPNGYIREHSLHWDTRQEGVENSTWYKMEGEAECQLSSDRILYRSSGSDLVGWAGNYGSKTTACSLILQI